MQGEVCFALLVVCLLHVTFIPDVETAVSEQMIKQMKDMHKKTCMARSGVKKEGLAKFMEEGVNDDPAFKKYTLCMLKNMQGFKNGKIAIKDIENQAKAMLPPPLRDAILDATSKCSNTGGDTPEDITYNFSKCSHKANVKSVMII
ncbi:unnamed protein product [Bemisia tabaci]|uniref:Uncharacterized protein n=2 Tax=Bemisia tabaci TaxID=7038 RepID=A0A9P0G3L6_BEMTA|nr:PREDICTED: uncharacterized protein LOC109029977 [Bemisia tabaci]CAH0768478.1 unnamed protein product [Bemisia tabaci]